MSRSPVKGSEQISHNVGKWKPGVWLAVSGQGMEPERDERLQLSSFLLLQNTQLMTADTLWQFYAENWKLSVLGSVVSTVTKLGSKVSSLIVGVITWWQTGDPSKVLQRMNGWCFILLWLSSQIYMKLMDNNTNENNSNIIGEMRVWSDQNDPLQSIYKVPCRVFSQL